MIVPAYTPVPGSGIMTNKASPQYPYLRKLSFEPFLARRAIQKADFLYQCHRSKSLLKLSKKKSIIGKTKILADRAITKTKTGFKSLSSPYGIPIFASPKGERLHKKVMIKSTSMNVQ